MSTHPDAEDDLDFTQPAKPGPPPPPERVASARKEAVKVTPQLAKTGFYVAMARHAGGRVTPRNGSRHSILIIEDDKDLSNLVGEVLADADGFQILERIRSNQKILKIPVIMMTGKSEVTDVARGLSLGADGYVTKPFKISGLVAAVNTVLGIDQASS